MSKYKRIYLLLTSIEAQYDQDRCCSTGSTGPTASGASPQSKGSHLEQNLKGRGTVAKETQQKGVSIKTYQLEVKITEC
jgi:hypothetical protein